MKLTNYTLPEFCFLDGFGPEGDSLEDRTVLQHIRSYTILEVVALNEVIEGEFTTPQFEFEYVNSHGVTEKHLFVLHFSISTEEDLPAIFEKCKEWYIQYLAWEDNNIDTDNHSSNN